MKTRNRQQQEIGWLKEKIILLERIIELERELKVVASRPAVPIWIPYEPYPYQPWNPTYQPTWIGDSTSQVITVSDQCQTLIN